MPSILGDDNNEENDKRQYLIKPEADVHYVNQSGDSMTGDLNMNLNKLSNAILDTCTVVNSAIRLPDDSVISKGYLDQRLQGLDAIYVNESGDTVEGDLSMSRHKITNLKYPENDTDAANKKYADRHKRWFKFNSDDNAATNPKIGDLEMLKPINMNGNKITGVPDPTNPGDAVNYKTLSVPRVTTEPRVIPVFFNLETDKRIKEVRLGDIEISLPSTAIQVNFDIHLNRGLEVTAAAVFTIDYISDMEISILDKDKNLLPRSRLASHVKYFKTKVDSKHYYWKLIFPEDKVGLARYLRVLWQYEYPANYVNRNISFYYFAGLTVSITYNNLKAKVTYLDNTVENDKTLDSTNDDPTNDETLDPTNDETLDSTNDDVNTKYDSGSLPRYILTPEALRALS
jgi:hypothetical protein